MAYHSEHVFLPTCLWVSWAVVLIGLGIVDLCWARSRVQGAVPGWLGPTYVLFHLCLVLQQASWTLVVTERKKGFKAQ